MPRRGRICRWLLDDGMGYFRFRKSIKIAPGIRWNIGKTGSSVSIGGRGITHTIGAKRSQTTVGIPGTGISYTHVHTKSKSPRPSPPPLPAMTSQKRRGRSNRLTFFYVAGFILLGIWLLTKFQEPVRKEATTPQSRIATTASSSPPPTHVVRPSAPLTASTLESPTGSPLQIPRADLG